MENMQEMIGPFSPADSSRRLADLRNMAAYVRHWRRISNEQTHGSEADKEFADSYMRLKRFMDAPDGSWANAIFVHFCMEICFNGPEIQDEVGSVPISYSESQLAKFDDMLIVFAMAMEAVDMLLDSDLSVTFPAGTHYIAELNERGPVDGDPDPGEILLHLIQAYLHLYVLDVDFRSGTTVISCRTPEEREADRSARNMLDELGMHTEE